MRRASDHAMLLVHRAKEAERQYARTKNIRDLTEVIRTRKAAKLAVITSTPDVPERKGIPIGQRWA